MHDTDLQVGHRPVAHFTRKARVGQSGRGMYERVVNTCIRASLVGGAEGFAADTSLIGRREEPRRFKGIIWP